MTSITSWIRLEPHCRNTDMNAGLQARIYDPLWLLARQWQVGEFQGEDNGSPAAARWQGDAARFTRYYPSILPDKNPVDGEPFDGNVIPLETLVEREPVRPERPSLEKFRFAIDASLEFFRILEQQEVSQDYRDIFRNTYPFDVLSDADRSGMDPESLSFIDLVAPRIVDGRKLYAAMRASLRPAPPAKPSLPPNLQIAHGDIAEVQLTAESWLQWYEAFASEPAAANAAWSPERMEYGFSMSARMASGEKVLRSREYYSGHLDWYDFNVDDGASLRAANDAQSVSVTRTAIPAPISYPGMPALRFWEFEDARVDFGSVDAGPEDLVRMLLIEFAISFGNDWFVMPVQLPVGSLCRPSMLVVTNTFGERFLIRTSNAMGGQFAAWRMFQLSSPPQPGTTNVVADGNADLFFVAPALPHTLESTPIEEVMLLRDEMANMAWAVERVIESPVERPLNRFEQQRSVPAAEPGQSEQLIYRVATRTPDNWVPLLPVQTKTGLRLQRGKVLKPDGSRQFVAARGKLLNPEGPDSPLAIFEEEIPREGVRITRHYQMARWQDGSTHLWIGRRKSVGRGEGSSGLKFDAIRE
jgi:hypothetical protein